MNSTAGETMSVIQVIQLMLAPAVMINACGLLLLGINNKYSLVVNRVRILNEERRRLRKTAGERDLNYDENVRLESISQQLTRLVYRMKLVRNCVLFDTTAVALFVLTSLFIGIDYFVPSINLRTIVIATFLIGMISVFCGVGFAFFETKKGYDIVIYEVKADE